MAKKSIAFIAALRETLPMSDDLLTLVYTELRRLAAAQLAKEKPGQTLQPTALVHEAWLRTELFESKIVEPASDEEMLAVHEALERLGTQDPQTAELVKLR